MLMLLTLLSACTVYQACDEMAVASVLVTPTHDGDPYPAEITATDDAGNVIPTECSPTQSGDTAVGGDGCTLWTVGWEVSGTIHIHAEAENDCNTGEADVDVVVEKDEAGCHVVTQAIELPITEWTEMGCL